jgi:hypothetical protein
VGVRPFCATFRTWHHLTGDFFYREADIVCVNSRLAASGARRPFPSGAGPATASSTDCSAVGAAEGLRSRRGASAVRTSEIPSSSRGESTDALEWFAIADVQDGGGRLPSARIRLSGPPVPLQTTGTHNPPRLSGNADFISVFEVIETLAENPSLSANKPRNFLRPSKNPDGTQEWSPWAFA